MKQKNVFCCEFCQFVTDDRIECEKHEAAHFGLTRKDYLDWRVLCKEASGAGKRVGVSKNKDTDAAFDAAVQRLCDFEENHGLETARKPSDFYL